MSDLKAEIIRLKTKNGWDVLVDLKNRRKRAKIDKKIHSNRLVEELNILQSMLTDYLRIRRVSEKSVPKLSTDGYKEIRV